MKKIFRISEWKNTHLLLLLTGIVIWSSYYETTFTAFAHIFFYLFFTALFLGSFAYYINDFFDIEKDTIAGKSNYAAKHTPFLRLIIIFSLVFLPLLIWYLLNQNTSVLFLIVIEISLLFIYSVSGIRIKERPILSVITDALYAYVIPGMVIICMYINSISLFNISHFIYLLWLFLIGIRGILSHHISDYYNDLRSATTTSATRYGINNIVMLQKFIVPPIELIVFIVFLFNIYKPILLVYILYLILTFLNTNNRKTIFNKYFLKPEVRLINLILDNFYYLWLPFLFLTLLSISNTQYLLVIPFFLVFFFERMKGFFSNVHSLLYEWIYRVGSFIVNYSLYYSFLIVGIDLKKRAKLKAKEKSPGIQPIEIKKTANNFPVLSEVKEKKVHGLWIGEKLSNMELLTIHSFLEHGYDFHLWVYNELNNVLPEQVKICDANEIISSDQIFTYKHRSQFGNGQGSVAGFSDIFRYKLLYEKGGWWVDMDITCLKPFDVEGDYFFRAHNSLDVVGNVIKAPAKSLLMKRCYEQAVETINEENKDWHKPIQILADNIADLNLKEHIYEGICNTDEFQKFEKYFFSDIHIPEKWKFIHWNNEILRIYGVHKNHSYYHSNYSRLLRKYGLMPEINDYRAIDNNYRKHLLFVNLKKML